MALTSGDFKRDPENKFVLPVYDEGNNYIIKVENIEIENILIEYWNINKLLNEYIKD